MYRLYSTIQTNVNRYAINNLVLWALNNYSIKIVASELLLNTNRNLMLRLKNNYIKLEMNENYLLNLDRKRLHRKDIP